LEIGVLTTNTRSDLEIVVMIKTTSWLERFDFQLWKSYSGHCEIRLDVEKVDVKKFQI